MGEIGIGICGLGAHAQRGHVDHLRAPGRVVAVCDPDEIVRTGALAALPDAVAYADLPSMLADPAVDAVIVCSPDRFHAEALVACVTAGAHVLVEKPVADTREGLARVRAALREADEAGLVVSSCHPRRFDPPFLWLRERLPRFAIDLGAPLDLHFDFLYHRPSRTGLHHGLLIDHVNHEVDLLHWLFGHCAFDARRLFDGEVRYGVSLAREDGVCATFSGSRHLGRDAYAELLRVRFERGEVEVDCETGIARVRDLDAGTIVEHTCGATDYQARFTALNDDFLAAIRDGRSPYLSRADLLVNTEIGIALTENGHFSYDGAATS